MHFSSTFDKISNYNFYFFYVVFAINRVCIVPLSYRNIQLLQLMSFIDEKFENVM